MKILGIDFTSAPSPRKPITCLRCDFSAGQLKAGELVELPDFRAFEETLAEPGPWIAGIDFPFGQARKFIKTIEWPQTWAGYVQHVGTLNRDEFRSALTSYRESRRPGDREHRRWTDVVAKSVSPQKLFGVPVGLMFFEGGPRIIKAGVTIPHLQVGDPERIVVEAYPGIVARHFIGRRSYKNDTRKKQTPELHAARADLLNLIGAKCKDRYGFKVVAPRELIEDPAGDQLDALLCAIQAAWAWQNREDGYGAPKDVDPLEGWIADPAVREGYPLLESKSVHVEPIPRPPEEAQLMEHALGLLSIADRVGRSTAELYIDVACHFIKEAKDKAQQSRPSGVRKSIEETLVRAKALRVALQSLDGVAWLQLSRHGLNATLTTHEDLPETALGKIARGEKPKFIEQLDQLIETSGAALADVPADKGGRPQPIVGLSAKQQAAAWCCDIAAKHSSLRPTSTEGSAFLQFVASVWELATGEADVSLERPVKEYLQDNR